MSKTSNLQKTLLFFSFLFLCPLVCFSQSKTTVTATIQAPNGNLATSGYVEFRLTPAGSGIAYRISGSNVIAPLTGRCNIQSNGTILATDNMSACQVWGNPVIGPANTCYNIAIAPGNTVSSIINNELISGTTYDLSSPTFCPSVTSVSPQQAAITVQPINSNLIPGANKVFNVGSSTNYYSSAYIDQIFGNGVQGVTTLNRRLLCDAFPGVDEAAKLSACFTNLPSTGGVADATGLDQTQTWGSDPFSGVTKPITLILGAATITMTATSTEVANVSIQAPFGAIFSPNVGITFTLKGGFDGTNSQHFSGAGIISFSGNTKLQEVHPEWWGAIADGVTASQTAFTNMTSALPSTGARVTLACGTYILTGWTILDKRVDIRGCGPGGASGVTDSSTILKSTTNAPVIKFTVSAYNSGIGRYNTIRDFAIQGLVGIGNLQHCIQVDNMGINAYNVYAWNCGGSGWFLSASVGSNFFNVQGMQNALDGMTIDDTATKASGGAVTASVISGGQFNTNSRDGIRFASHGWDFSGAGFIVEGNSGYGINCSNVSGVDSTQYIHFTGIHDELNVTGSAHFAANCINNTIGYTRVASGVVVNDTSTNPNVIDGPNLITQTAGITSSSVANPTVITLSAVNSTMLSGMLVLITGHTGSTPSLNGTWYPITKTDTTHFTIPVNVTVGGTGGSLIFANETPTAGMNQLLTAMNGYEVLLRDPRQTAFVGAQGDHFTAMFGCSTTQMPPTTDTFRTCNNRGLTTATTAGTSSSVIVLNTNNDVTLGDASANSVKVGAPGFSLSTTTFGATPSLPNGTMWYCTDCRGPGDAGYVANSSCATGGGNGNWMVKINGATKCY